MDWSAGAPLANAANRCAAVQFIGVRGSGEPQGYGPTVDAARVAFQAASRKTNGAYALVYPASHQPFLEDATTKDFIESVNAGRDNLRAYLADWAQRCPSQTFVLAGYSQGAFVIDAALSGVASNIVDRVKGVALFGDPIFTPNDPFDVGNYSHFRRGVIRDILLPYASANHLPTSIEGRTQSYCLLGDPVCSYGVVNLVKCYQNIATNTCPHQEYPSLGYTTTAGRYLAGRSDL